MRQGRVPQDSHQAGARHQPGRSPAADGAHNIVVDVSLDAVKKGTQGRASQKLKHVAPRHRLELAGKRIPESVVLRGIDYGPLQDTAFAVAASYVNMGDIARFVLGECSERGSLCYEGCAVDRIRHSC
jgi:hypothetical protein